MQAMFNELLFCFNIVRKIVLYERSVRYRGISDAIVKVIIIVVANVFRSLKCKEP